MVKEYDVVICVRDLNENVPKDTIGTVLIVYNATNFEFQLLLHLTKDNLVGEWRSTEESMNSYELYEKEHSITPALFGGYVRNNIIYRRTYNKNIGLIKDEYVTENHAYMIYNPYLSV